MRDFVFRGISNVDEDNDSAPAKGTWVYGQLVFANNLPFIVGNVDEVNDEYISLEKWCSVDPTTVGQFTGRKANDKNVFQGDILTFDGDRDLTVVWAEEGVWALKGKKAFTSFSHVNIEDAVIVGNIHENPELRGEEAK